MNSIHLPKTESKQRRPYKRREETLYLEAQIWYVFTHEGYPLTVRRVFYALTVLGAVPKSEAGYRQAQYVLTRMRRAGRLPYGYIADNTRWQIRPTTYRGMSSALAEFQATYRRNLWAEQPYYCEVWVEKDALASVISNITEYYGVPLWVARGFSSLSALSEAAEQITEQCKPAYIAHLGDYDPSGVLAAQKIAQELRAFGADIHFERLAVTPEQITQYNLPTRPTKPSKHAAFLGWPSDRPSCELDALPTPILKDLVKNWIEQFIDQKEWVNEQRTEQLERDTLAAVTSQYFGAGTKLSGGAS